MLHGGLANSNYWGHQVSALSKKYLVNVMDSRGHGRSTNDGDRDEGIKGEDTEFLAAQIPNAGLLIQPQVSHFSFMQDPDQFNNDVLHFLRSR